jgi:hypothetical protein
MSDCHRLIAYGVTVFFNCCVSRVFDLVYCKISFGNKYIILWHWVSCIHFLYGMCVNLIPGHTYYEYSVLA